MRMLGRMAIVLPLGLAASGAIGQPADALAGAKPMLIVALGDSTAATARDWAAGIHPNQSGQRLVCALLTSRIAEVAARTPAR